MTASVTERLDALVADNIALEAIVWWMISREDPSARAAGLAYCREVIDTLSANPKANARGQWVFQRAHQNLERIFAG